MHRVNKIIANSDFREYLQRNVDAEIDRFFCHHNFDHLLAVARLTYIILLEEGSPLIRQEVAYAAGLLHDIGRWLEYRRGIDHARASSRLAGDILDASGFSTAEQDIIRTAILQHRQEPAGGENGPVLSRALYRADKLSRLCFLCRARDECRSFEKRPHREKLLY